MDTSRELDQIADQLKKLKQLSNKMFVSQIELRINLELLAEKQEEIRIRNQYLQHLGDYILEQQMQQNATPD